jgi:hypothetical protein
MAKMAEPLFVTGDGDGGTLDPSGAPFPNCVWRLLTAAQSAAVLRFPSPPRDQAGGADCGGGAQPPRDEAGERTVKGALLATVPCSSRPHAATATIWRRWRPWARGWAAASCVRCASGSGVPYLPAASTFAEWLPWARSSTHLGSGPAAMRGACLSRSVPNKQQQITVAGSAAGRVEETPAVQPALMQRARILCNYKLQPFLYVRFPFFSCSLKLRAIN